jgi:hypothetical protein
MISNKKLNRITYTNHIIIYNSINFYLFINSIKSFHTTSKTSLNPFNWVIYLDNKTKSINIELNKEIIDNNVKLLSDRL